MKTVGAERTRREDVEVKVEQSHSPKGPSAFPRARIPTPQLSQDLLSSNRLPTLPLHPPSSDHHPPPTLDDSHVGNRISWTFSRKSCCPSPLDVCHGSWGCKRGFPSFGVHACSFPAAGRPTAIRSTSGTQDISLRSTGAPFSIATSALVSHSDAAFPVRPNPSLISDMSELLKLLTNLCRVSLISHNPPSASMIAWRLTDS